ncbi:unnamed protein product [Closterium sp. NIES-54]
MGHPAAPPSSLCHPPSTMHSKCIPLSSPHAPAFSRCFVFTGHGPPGSLPASPAAASPHRRGDQKVGEERGGSFRGDANDESHLGCNRLLNSSGLPISSLHPLPPPTTHRLPPWRHPPFHLPPPYSDSPWQYQLVNGTPPIAGSAKGVPHGLRQPHQEPPLHQVRSLPPHPARRRHCRRR